MKILCQNVLDGFSDDQTARALLQLVQEQNPDVAIFPEAYDARESYSGKRLGNGFETAGYEVVQGLYGDRDGRKDQHGMIVLVRRELLTSDRISRFVTIGERQVAEVWLQDAKGQLVQIVGVHLNDRSEAMRQRELDDLLDGVVETDHPVIVAGDLNGIHARDAHGPLLWATRMLAWLVDIHVLPVRQTDDPRRPPKGLGRIGSLALRFRDMISGRTVERFEQAGFTDADTLRRPTHPSGRPLAQMDHIMVRDGLKVVDFTVLPRNFSDHLPVVAKLTL